MHYRDLDICHYHSGPFDADNWNVPLRSIGWLDHPHDFNRGPVSIEVLSKLETLVRDSRVEYSHYYFRGVHMCSLCTAAGLASPGPVWSQENIFVPGNGVVYVAPGGIVHYVQVHSYFPPPEFADAVLVCPSYGSTEFIEALTKANLGKHPPLESQKDAFAMFDKLKTKSV